MARAVPTRTKVGYTVAAWVVALLIFFPILYTIITSLKTEPEAIAGFSLIPSFTLRELPRRSRASSNYFKPFMNSVILAVGSTILGADRRHPRGLGDGLLADQAHQGRADVDALDQDDAGRGVLVPIYLIFLRLGLLDTRLGLTIVLMLINLPIIIWMLYTYFREIPGEILEAARMDGATLWGEIWHVLTPMAVPGIASTLLLNIILAWNESFWTIRLDHDQRRAADRLHRQLLLAAGPVLGQALGGLGDGDRADPDHGLVQPEAARPRPDLRRREVRRNQTMGTIQLRDVNKSFGATVIIPKINLDIEDGEFVVFVGPSGCGKSTLLRLIAGLEDTTSGKIIIDGRDVTDESPAKRQLAMVFQSYALYPHMTVAQEHRLPAEDGRRGPGLDRQEGGERRPHPQPHQLPRAPPRPALRRPAPARRDRPRHRPPALGLPVRRAALQPRRRAARHHAPRDLRAAPAARQDDDLRHPRPGRGDDHGRQDRRAERRQHRAGRLAARALPQAAATSSSRASSAARR